jgi:predicted nucleotidyltransferase
MVKKKHTATEIRKIVKAMVALLTENNVPVEKMILYGSYANGMPRAYSDIDVAVISPAFRGKKLIETQAELAKILAKYLAMVEPVGYSPDAFRTAEPETMLGEIKRTGKVLFAA